MKERKTYLDIIRSSSVLIIVLFHFSCLLEDFNYKWYNNFFLHYANGKWGRVGVFLFFMISGAGLMLSSKTGFEWKKFLKKRWVRIFPLFYLCYIPLYFVDAIFVHKDFLYAGSPWKFFLTIIGMDGYLKSVVEDYYIIGEWFLGALIIIYICFPLLKKIFDGKFRKIFSTVLIILVVVNNFFHIPFIPEREWIVFDIFAFWSGMLLTEYDNILKRRMNLIIAIVLSMILLWIKIPSLWNTDIVVILMGYSLFVIGVHCPDRVDGRIVSMFGKYSYAIFLTHHVIQAFYFEMFSTTITRVTVIPIIILLSSITLLVSILATKINTLVIDCFTRCGQRMKKK